ncbi:FeoC-like transcriptional regulator [Neisseriaceae bacterium CLB008]|nr:FeoC-like transcriptional regulator [Neisseriaceae bacterium]
MLFAIKAHIGQHPNISLNELAHYFDVSPSAMQAMVGQWMRKGHVIATEAQSGCRSSCGGCTQACANIYYRCRPEL